MLKLWKQKGLSVEKFLDGSECRIKCYLKKTVSQSGIAIYPTTYEVFYLLIWHITHDIITRRKKMPYLNSTKIFLLFLNWFVLIQWCQEGCVKKAYSNSYF